jgi:hypothetical protein
MDGCAVAWLLQCNITCKISAFDALFHTRQQRRWVIIIIIILPDISCTALGLATFLISTKTHSQREEDDRCKSTMVASGVAKPKGRARAEGGGNSACSMPPFVINGTERHSEAGRGGHAVAHRRQWDDHREVFGPVPLARVFPNDPLGRS